VVVNIIPKTTCATTKITGKKKETTNNNAAKPMAIKKNRVRKISLNKRIKI
jgi:hypothetical protein